MPAYRTNIAARAEWSPSCGVKTLMCTCRVGKKASDPESARCFGVGAYAHLGAHQTWGVCESSGDFHFRNHGNVADYNKRKHFIGVCLPLLLFLLLLLLLLLPSANHRHQNLVVGAELDCEVKGLCELPLELTTGQLHREMIGCSRSQAPLADQNSRLRGFACSSPNARGSLAFSWLQCQPEG